MNAVRLRILAMAASAMVTIAAVTIGIGLSMVLVWSKPSARPQNSGTMATIVQEHAALDGDLQPPADPRH